MEEDNYVYIYVVSFMNTVNLTPWAYRIMFAHREAYKNEPVKKRAAQEMNSDWFGKPIATLT